jgi:hypothetical protein
VYGREVTHGYHSRVVAAVERLLNGSLIEMKYNFPRYDRRPHRVAAVAEAAAVEVSQPALL